MPYHRGVARDVNGNAITDASVFVYLEGTTTKATLWSNPALDVALSNPVITGSDGVYEFYVDSGIYDLYIAATGFDTVILTDTAIGPLYGETYLATAGAVAQNVEPSYLPVGGTWASGEISSGVFTHAGTNGILTYIGDATQMVLLNFHALVSVSADNAYFFIFAIDGAILSPKRPLAYSMLAATAAYQFGITRIVEVKTGETLSVMTAIGAGSGNLTMANGATFTAQILS